MAQLSGLLRSAFAQPDLHSVREADLRTGETPALRVEGPAALRPFLAGAALAENRTVLVVTATDREAEDLGAAAADLIDAHTVAVLPSWETLPHERLSPRPDTVGRRLTLFRRLATDDAPRVVVAAARSLIQPIAPGLGALEPVRLAVGDTARLRRAARPPRRARLHAGRDGQRARRVRGARRHRRHLPAHRRAPRARRVLGRRGQRAALLLRRRPALRRTPSTSSTPPAAASCCSPTPSASAPPRSAATHENNPPLRELLEHLAAGHPDRGHGVAHPRAGRGRAAAAHRPAARGRAVLVADPERVRTRSADLVRTGQEFLEASAGSPRAWAGGAPIDVGASAYRDLVDVLEHATATGHPVVTLSPLLSGRDDALVAARPRGRRPTAATSTARSSTSAPTSPPAAPPCSCSAATAPRSARWSSSATPRCPRCWPTSSPDEPEKGLVTVTCGRIVEGFTAGGARGAHRGRPHRQPRRDHRDPQARLAPSQRRRPGHPAGPATTSCTPSTASAASSRCASAPCRAPRASTWCWSTRRPSAASPPTASSCPPTRSTR